MDKVIIDHNQENLLKLFPQTQLVTSTSLLTILAKETTVPWLLFLPKSPIDDLQAMNELYGEMHKIALGMNELGYGHFNLAKIGNKNEWLHFHLVFRDQNDEAWPDAVWCREPLTKSIQTAELLCQDVRKLIAKSS